MPKVLIFDAAYPPPVIGGKEKQAHLLACALVRKGFDIQVLSFRHAPVQPALYEGVKVRRITSSFLRFPLLLLYLCLYRFKTNIIHIHTPSWVGVVTLVFSRVIGFKTVFKFPNEKMLGRKRGFAGKTWRSLVKRAHVIVVLDQQSGEDLRKIGFPERRIFQAHNGVAIKGPASPKDNPGKRLLFVGRLVEQKGCGDLLLACKKINEEVKEWELAVVGEGPLRGTLQELAVKLNLADKIYFTGYQPDVRRWLDKCDLMVVPSHREGMSNVILEAMSMGVPVAATRVGGTPLLLGDSGAPYMCPAGDSGALAAVIKRLLTYEPERAAYGKALLTRCKERFDIDIVAGTYVSVYKKLLEFQTGENS